MLPVTNDHQGVLALLVVAFVVAFGVGFWLGGKR